MAGDENATTVLYVESHFSGGIISFRSADDDMGQRSDPYPSFACSCRTTGFRRKVI